MLMEQEANAALRLLSGWGPTEVQRLERARAASVAREAADRGVDTARRAIEVSTSRTESG